VYPRSARLGWGSNGTAPGARLMRLGNGQSGAGARTVVPRDPVPHDLIPWNPAAPMSRPLLAGLGQDYGTPVVAWDPTLTVSSGRQPVQNNGCPPGYFAQFVAPGELGAVSIPGKTYALRCRLMATTTAETIKDESGISMSEAVEVYRQAVADTVHQVGGAVSAAFSWSPWILGAVAVIVGGIVVLRVVK